jgi:hypothetical protein
MTTLVRKCKNCRLLPTWRMMLPENRFALFGIMLTVICSHVLTLPADLSIPERNEEIETA